MNITRRVFLKNGGIAMLGLSSLPLFLQRAVAASTAGAAGSKKMVVLFQRGAMDGLNVVVPFGERNYYAMRPTIAIPEPRRGTADSAIDLDGFFGLHPSLQPLAPLFHSGQLAIVQAAGSPDPTSRALGPARGSGPDRTVPARLGGRRGVRAPASPRSRVTGSPRRRTSATGSRPFSAGRSTRSSTPTCRSSSSAIPTTNGSPCARGCG